MIIFYIQSVDEVNGENISGNLIQDRRLGGENEDSRRNRTDEVDHRDEAPRDEVFNDEEDTDEFGRKRTFSKINEGLSTSREKSDRDTDRDRGDRDRDNNSNKRTRNSASRYRGSNNYSDNRGRGGKPHRDSYNNNNQNNYNNNNNYINKKEGKIINYKCMNMFILTLRSKTKIQ